MWYFAWILGVGFAVLLAVLNAMWGENAEGRAADPELGANPVPVAAQPPER